jgi:hypothetical protein
LLTSSSAPVLNRAGQVVAKVGLVASEGQDAGLRVAFGEGRARPLNCRPVDGMSVASPLHVSAVNPRIVFDPTEPAELARAESQLCSLGRDYRFVVRQTGTLSPRVITSDSDSARRSFPVALQASTGGRYGPHPGLFYRRAAPFILSIYKVCRDDPGTTEFLSATELSLPNDGPIVRLTLPALAVTIQEGVTFQGGMLAARPGLPMAKPRRRFQIKFNSAGDDSDLLSEQGFPLSTRTEAGVAASGKSAPAE